MLYMRLENNTRRKLTDFCGWEYSPMRGTFLHKAKCLAPPPPSTHPTPATMPITDPVFAIAKNKSLGLIVFVGSRRLGLTQFEDY